MGADGGVSWNADYGFINAEVGDPRVDHSAVGDSANGGRTWDFEREVLLVGDSPTSDCGYFSTVQLDDGTIVTVLYYADGSETAARGESWGKVSCLAIRYREEGFDRAELDRLLAPRPYIRGLPLSIMRSRLKAVNRLLR